MRTVHVFSIIALLSFIALLTGCKPEGIRAKKNTPKRLLSSLLSSLTGLTATSTRITKLNTVYGDTDMYSEYLAASNTLVYYSSNYGINGKRLFKFDGTATALSNTSNGGNDNPYQFALAGSVLYFTAYNEKGYTRLYRYDPATTSGLVTTPIAEINGTGDFYLTYNSNSARSDRLYFTGCYTVASGSTICKLYMVMNNSTSVVTSPVAELNIGDSDVQQYEAPIVSSSGDVYVKGFSAGSGGAPLTRLHNNTLTQVSNITGNNTDSVGSITPVNTRIYFTAYDLSWNQKLYMFDEITQSVVTAPVSDTNTGSGDYPYNMFAAGNNLVFNAYDINWDSKFYMHDGTGIASVPAFNIVTNPIAETNTIFKVNQTNGYVYFKANFANWADSLYKFKYSTPAVPPVRISDTAGGSANSVFIQNTPSEGSFCFKAYDAAGTDHMYYYDGVSTATTPISNINPGFGDQIGQQANGWLTDASGCYFTATDSSGHIKTYHWDGNPLHVVSTPIAETNPGSDDVGIKFFSINSKAFFQSRNSSNDTKGYMADATTITLAANTNSTGMSDDLIAYSQFVGQQINPTVSGDYLYFVASLTDPAIFKWKLYVRKPTDSGYTTTPICDTNPGGNNWVLKLTPYLTHDLLFASRDAAGDEKLYHYHGDTGVCSVAEILPTTGGSLVQDIKVVGNYAYIVHREDNVLMDERLYRYDGVTPISVPVSRVAPLTGGHPYEMVKIQYVLPNGVVFMARLANSLQKLFRCLDTDATCSFQLTNTAPLASDLTWGSGLFYKHPDGSIYFTSNGNQADVMVDSNRIEKIYKLNLSALVTTPSFEIFPIAQTRDNIYSLSAGINGKIMIGATDDSFASHMYVWSSGSNPPSIPDPPTGSLDSVSNCQILDSKYVCIGYVNGNSKLVEYDPVAGTSKAVSDIAPGGDDGLSSVIFELDGYIYFAGSLVGSGELFRYDGINVVTAPVVTTSISSSFQDGVSNVQLIDGIIHFTGRYDSNFQHHFAITSSTTGAVTPLTYYYRGLQPNDYLYQITKWNGAYVSWVNNSLFTFQFN